MAQVLRLRPDAARGTAVALASVTPKDNPCHPGPTTVRHRSHSYTVVGEHHAYWNAKGGLSYTTGATSSIGFYESATGTIGKDGGWTFSGYLNYSTGTTLQMGTTEGPYNSHQVVLSMAYDLDKYETICVHGGTYVSYGIQEAGIYNPGHGWTVIKDGKRGGASRRCPCTAAASLASFCRSDLRSCSALATAIRIRAASRPESVPRSMIPSASANRTPALSNLGIRYSRSIGSRINRSHRQQNTTSTARPSTSRIASS